MIKAILGVANKILEHFSPAEREKRRLKEVSKVKEELANVEFALSKLKIFKEDKDSHKYYALWRRKHHLSQRLRDLSTA